MTPGYKIKHWWRRSRAESESLRRFARRQRGEDNQKDERNAGVAAAWCSAKGIAA